MAEDDDWGDATASNSWAGQQDDGLAVSNLLRCTVVSPRVKGPFTLPVLIFTFPVVFLEICKYSFRRAQSKDRAESAASN